MRRTPSPGGNGVRRDGRSDYLKASLTFSPACFRLPLVSSAWPSAWRSRSSVASPSASLPLPESSSALFFILSIPLMRMHSFSAVPAYRRYLPAGRVPTPVEDFYREALQATEENAGRARDEPCGWCGSYG